MPTAAFDVGAIVVATGAQAAASPWGQFRYDGKRVVTQTRVRTRAARLRTPPASVVMILCAGQRNEAVPYCSGVCCLGALKQALAVKAANPQASVTILFRDLNLQGDKSGEKTLARGAAGRRGVHALHAVVAPAGDRRWRSMLAMR